MKKYLLFLIGLLALSSTHAQTGSLSGRVYDSVNVKVIPYASISAIRKSDSVLVKHTRSNIQGKFTLNALPADTFIVLIAHASFIDFVDEVNMHEKEVKNLGDYNLIQRGSVLRDVIISNKAGIKVKGDTLEFLADSFKVKQGAMVEDLLKVLPGIQVNKKGEITAMGEKVEKVLVDGEEFFGDDPTVATQNIQSKVIDKVQVFDKKSEQAAFTGFDDGQEQKTINLKLKKNMNKGVFGKVELGGGPDDRWQNQGMINSFKNKRQISAYGLMSSNGKTGLGWEDKNKYTGDGPSMQMDEDGGFMWNSFDGEEDGNSWGAQIPEGYTKAWTGGVHFADKWNENKQHINTNYSFGRVNRTKSERSYTENLFPGNTFESIDTSQSFSSRNTHKLTTRYEFNPDTSLAIIYNLNSRVGFTDGETQNTTGNINSNEVPISQRKTINTSTATTARVNNQLTINKKFKKAGRTLSFNSSYNYNKNSGHGDLSGDNAFTIGGTLTHNLIDQKKEDDYLSNVGSADLTYTEPLSKKFLLKTSYGFSSENTESGKKTYVKAAGSSQYTTLIDSLSNVYSLQVISHTAGTELKYNEKKYNVTLGAKVRYSSFDQHDAIRNKQYNYNRVNLFPTLRFNYKFDQFRRFTFSYSGSTKQPSITQLQPVQDNTNPINIVVGNPNLKIAYNQNININYFSYQVLSSRSIYAGLMGGNTFNNISSTRILDSLGRTVTSYVNLNGGYNASLWGGINTKLFKSAFEGKLNLNGSFANTPNIINQVKGNTHTVSMTFTPGIAYTKEDKYYFSLDLGTIYTLTKNSLQTSRDIRFFSFAPSASVTYSLPHHFEIGTDADYQYNPPVGPYTNSFSRFIWNGELSYKMLANKNLEWNLSMKDILNQNRGYERNTSINNNTERYFATLGRYWMVGMVWNFNTGPVAKGQNAGPKGPRPGGGRRMRMMR